MPWTAKMPQMVTHPLSGKAEATRLMPFAVTGAGVIAAHLVCVGLLGIHPASFAVAVGVLAVIALLVSHQAVGSKIGDTAKTIGLTARLADMERKNAALQLALTSAQARFGSLKAECDDLALQLTIDPLTGVQNRRGLEAAFEAQGVGTIMALLDIDHFKRINDTLGHDVGDRVLRDFATRLRTHLPADLPVYRVGGEEFVIMFPRARMHDVADVLAGFRRDLSGGGMTRQTDRVSVSFSAGLASLENAAQDFETVFKKADERLYKAKTTGRAKTVFRDDVHLQAVATAA